MMIASNRRVMRAAATIRTAATIATASSMKAAGISLPKAIARCLRAAAPPSVPITAPTMPAMPPTTSEPAAAPIAAPDSAAETRRVPNCIGTVRLGVDGSWSTTVSTSTITVRIHGVQA